jgi:hypothetical protein
MRACCHSGREPLHSGREPTLTACYLQALGRFVQAGFAPLPASSSILHLHPASGLRPRFRRSFPVFCARASSFPDIDYLRFFHLLLSTSTAPTRLLPAGDPSQDVARPPQDSGPQAFGGHHLLGFLLHHPEGHILFFLSYGNF